MTEKDKPISSTELASSLLVISEAAKSLAVEVLLGKDKGEGDDSDETL